jgi:chemotaxis protein MotB
MSTHGPETIIIVRKAKGHGGHHGGAWKVAYADFVTAMMAFFLVMWLVAQSKEVKSAVGGYFRDPGIFEYDKGKGVLPGGQPGVEAGGAPQVGPADNAEAEAQKLRATADLIQSDLTKVPAFAGLREQVKFSVSSEGLRIDLMDRAQSSFFASGSAVLRGESEQILALIAYELGALTNDVVIEGHTDSAQYADAERYGNFELSAERANAARRVMERHGLRPAQVRAVRGFADRQLQLPDDPLDARNRRVSIVVQSAATRSMEESLRASAASADQDDEPEDEPDDDHQDAADAHGAGRAKAEQGGPR